MSGQTTHTLKSLFTADVGRPIAEEAGFAQALEGLKSVGGVPAVAAGGLAGAFGNALEEMLSPELGDILAGSWSKVAAVADALERTRSSETAMFVPLLDHKITARHLPTVDLVCAGKAVASLAFDIGVTFDLKGVELEIRQGAVAGVKAGRAAAQAMLGLAGKTLLQKATPDLALPGRLAIGRAG